MPPGWVPTASGEAIIRGFDAWVPTLGRVGPPAACGAPAAGSDLLDPASAVAGMADPGNLLPARPRNGVSWLA
jgi:hypothetical protein